MIKKISIKVIFSFFGILASAHIAQGNEACISFYKKSGLASAIATSEKKERVKQYRTKVAELWNQEAFTVAADTLHKSWQETNAYQTRYKVMADENNTPIIDIKKYMRNAGIPESY